MVAHLCGVRCLWAARSHNANIQSVYAYPSTGDGYWIAGYIEIGFYLCCDVVASQLCTFCCRIKDLFYYTMNQAYLLYDYYESM